MANLKGHSSVPTHLVEGTQRVLNRLNVPNEFVRHVWPDGRVLVEGSPDDIDRAMAEIGKFRYFAGLPA